MQSWQHQTWQHHETAPQPETAVLAVCGAVLAGCGAVLAHCGKRDGKGFGKTRSESLDALEVGQGHTALVDLKALRQDQSIHGTTVQTPKQFSCL